MASTMTLPIVGVPGAADVADSLQAVERDRKAAAREADGAGELGWRERAGAAEDVDHLEVGSIDADSPSPPTATRCLTRWNPISTAGPDNSSSNSEKRT